MYFSPPSLVSRLREKPEHVIHEHLGTLTPRASEGRRAGAKFHQIRNQTRLRWNSKRLFKKKKRKKIDTIVVGDFLFYFVFLYILIFLLLFWTRFWFFEKLHFVIVVFFSLMILNDGFADRKESFSASLVSTELKWHVERGEEGKEETD